MEDIQTALELEVNTPLNPNFGMSDYGYLSHAKGDFVFPQDVTIEEGLTSITN